MDIACILMRRQRSLQDGWRSRGAPATTPLLTSPHIGAQESKGRHPDARPQSNLALSASPSPAASSRTLSSRGAPPWAGQACWSSGPSWPSRPAQQLSRAPAPLLASMPSPSRQVRGLWGGVAAGAWSTAAACIVIRGLARSPVNLIVNTLYIAMKGAAPGCRGWVW